MGTQSKRIARRERQRRKRLRRWLVGGTIGGAVVGLIVLVTLASFQPAQGESVPIEGANHAPIGELPARVGAEPPTSGTHYGRPAEAGFYDEPVEDGYLIHNLEHGYVIIWYNCDGIDQTACEGLKDGVRQVIATFRDAKVIGVPRDGMEATIALTSWGRIDRLEWFDEARVRSFIQAWSLQV